MKRQNENLFLTTILALFLCLFASPETRAQRLQASLSHFSTDNGLASNAISHMVQDDYGFIWLATWNGLSRFDGYDFYNYTTGNGSGIPNLHNRILSLSVDNQQNIWMRMYDGRVFVMKRSIDKIINPFENVNGSEEFRTNYPLTVTSVGDVLVFIDGVGLFIMRVEKDRVNTQLIPTAGMEITSMAEGYQNDIWLGTNKGVHRMDIANLTIESKGLFPEESVTCLYSNGYSIYVGTQSGNIYNFAYGQESKLVREGKEPLNAIYVDSQGLIWFSDPKKGVHMFDPETGQEKQFTQNITVPDYSGMGGTFREAVGVLWIRMNHGGYGYYNRETGQVEYFHNDPAHPWNLSNTVNASLELDEGVIWESTSRRGLEKLEILKNTISRRMLVPGKEQTPANEIRAIYYDQERRLLLMGNKDNSLFIIREDSSRTVITKDSQGHPLGRIYGISKDRKGNYWICSKGDGVFKMTPQGNGYHIENFRHSDSDPYSLNNDQAYYALEDKDGNIWVATYGGGVNVLTKNKEGKMVFLHPQNSMKTYPYRAYKKVRTLALDRTGNVWAGTTDGILIMSLRHQAISIKQMKVGRKESDHILMSNDINCIVHDRIGNMWVGTNGGGIAHSIGKDSKGNWLFESFGVKDGLPGEEVFSITFDSRGTAWFTTDHVVCSFDPNKHIFSTFSNLDGVDETMCSENAAITVDNDNIIIGTINGYYAIDRRKLTTTAASMLKLRITDFWVDGQLQSPRFNHGYDFYVPDSRQVRLPSHNSTIDFRFASLNYQLQHRIHYQYMLDGSDRVWQNADKTRIASYSNLPTGHYKFRVRAFLLEAPDKYDQRVIEIIVPPIFMLSSSAIWLYMVLFAIIAISFMFWRQNDLQKMEDLRRMNSTSQEVTYKDDDEAQFMSSLMDWLDRYGTTPSMGLTAMFEAAKMSEEEYSKRLFQYTGLAPYDLLMQHRINKAVRLLEGTNDNLAAVAYNAGFDEPTNFGRIFKSIMGVSPSTYRDEYRKSQGLEEVKQEIKEETKAEEVATEKVAQPEKNETDDYELL